MDASTASLARRMTARVARAAALVGTGVAIAFGGALLGPALAAALAPAGSTTGPASGIALWVTDRDGHALVGLDGDLLVARRTDLGWPLAVGAVQGGGTWVLRSGNAGAGFGQRLTRVTRQGAVAGEVYVDRCADLDVLEGEDALVIAAGDGAGGLDRAARVARSGALTPLIERAGLSAIVGSRSSVVVGTRGGEVLRVAPDGTGAVLASRALGGEVGDLARGPGPGELWVLDVAGATRLLLLGADLAPRWERAPPFAAAHLAPVEGEERAWLVDRGAPRVARLGPGGALELDRGGLPAGGLGPAAAFGGGLVVTSPGALVRIDAAGGLLPGQGGFAWLTDVTAVR